MAKRLREALEAALRENPDDLAAHMAWADHAAESGDPRGEFAQVQIALEDPTRSPEQRKELQAREKELLAKHRDEWLGPMAVLFDRTGYSDIFDEEFGLQSVWYEECKYRFVRGWLDLLHFDAFTPSLLQAVAECPTTGLLRDFGLNHDDYEVPAIGDIADLPFLGTLRKFRLGYESGSSRVQGEGITPAIAKMPRLEELWILARWTGMGEIFALPQPPLRTLVAYHMHDYPLHVLADNPTMGNLITLDCYAHALEPEDDEAYIRQDGFIRMVRSPHLRSLTHLTLRLHEIGDAGIEALIDSGMLRRLKTLDLTGGDLTDVSARRLAASPDVRGLTKLTLTNNYLTDEGIGALLEVGVNLVADEQFNPELLSDDMEEREHLWYGDCE
jgi:uncharacterized protein (TIGR02996 family)